MMEIEVSPNRARDAEKTQDGSALKIALLTGGSDRPYVFGLAMELTARGAAVDLIGSDELDLPEFRERARIRFLIPRRVTAPHASFAAKVLRIVRYYVMLLAYAATSRPKIFHILWNNKFELLDRTVLMLYYRLLGKKILITVHNVNAAKRDNQDSTLNRLTLRTQYRLAYHLFVHTERMKQALMTGFRVDAHKITVIPFGINNFAPNSALKPYEARHRLGLQEDERTILFFGRITPYKGLEFLISAFRKLSENGDHYRLLIAGREDRCAEYWSGIKQDAHEEIESGRIRMREEYIPEDETEVYFKSADVLVLPYREIYQSGVLFLAHSFGLPVIAANVGSLADDIVEGENGLICEPESPDDLAKKLADYFQSRLYRELESRRMLIREDANRRHSWTIVGQRTLDAYAHATGASAKQDIENVASSLYALEGKLASTDERKR